jgi:hypothetical protein
MPSIRRLRHTLTKSPLHVPLAWLYHRGLTGSDILLASYPRSGNGWMRHLLFELLTGEEAFFWKVEFAFPIVGRHWRALRLLPEGGRLLKTHEPPRREYRKAIYLVRDARDVAVSEYHFQVHEGLFAGTMDSFLSCFLRGTVNAYGSWMRHVESWQDAAARGNCDVLTIRYEDLRRMPEDTLQRVCAFLAIPATRADVEAAVQHNSIQRMRGKGTDPSLRPPGTSPRNAPLIRAGTIGGWREILNTGQIQALEYAAGATLLRMGYSLSDNLLNGPAAE